MRILSAVLFVVGVCDTARAQAVAGGSPVDWAARAHLRVERVDVPTTRGFNARMIVSRPADSTGRLPAVLFVPWLSCDPVEVSGATDDGYIRFTRDLASITRFVVARAEKPGVDGSGGPDCAVSTLDDDMVAFRGALAALRERADVDSNNIFLVGGSIGGALAVVLASEQARRVAGVVSVNSFARTWYEHMIDHERRRLALLATPAEQFGPAMRGLELFYTEFLIRGLMPGDVLRAHPELRAIWYDTTSGQYGRPARYFHEVQALDLDQELASLAVPALFVGGEYDWVMGSQEPAFAVSSVARHHANLATARVYPRMSHGLHVYASMDDAFHGRNGHYEATVAEDVAAWLRAHLPSASRAPNATPDTTGIAALHQLDIAATLADRADELVKLWDPEAVRIQPGGPVEVGRATIYADDKRAEEKTGPGKTVCYRSEIKNIEIAGDWAFEWGYFSYKEAGGTPMHGKVLRVMHRQLDGGWKFARVAGFVDRSGVRSPMSRPCT